MTIGFIIQRTWCSTNANVIILVYFHCFRLLFCANFSDFILILYFYRYHRCHSIVIFCSFFYALRFIYVYRVYIHKCSSSNGSTNIVAFICHVDHTISSHILIFILFSISFHINILLARDKCRRMIRGIIYMQTRIKQLQKRPLKLCIHWIRIHLFPIYVSRWSFKFLIFTFEFICVVTCAYQLWLKSVCVSRGSVLNPCSMQLQTAIKNMNYLHQVSVYVMTKSVFCLFGCSYTTQQLNNS